jgi:adenosylhomocysteinase
MDEDILLKGVRRLEWAKTHMGLTREIRDRLKKERAFKGLKVGMALHVEAKTGILAWTIREAGADVRLASCNPLSTDDSVSLALKDEYGMDVYARKGETKSEYYDNLNSILDLKPDFLIDDGGDLIFLTHTKRRDVLESVKGANEETTTGIIRLRAMAESGELEFPVISVNDADMKHLFDNRYGTGQSTLDGIMSSTNLLIAGKTFAVSGYGWCGRGIAMRAKGMGAHVVVTEVDPVRAVEAKLDGFEVMRMTDAAKISDFVVSATGCKDVFTAEHLDVVKDGCILANAGHFDNEISKDALSEASTKVEQVREYVERYDLKNGRSVYLLGEGRLINLVAGQGHPVEIMDMSFSIQALALEYLTKNHEALGNKVYEVPRGIDEEVARLKLKTMGIEIDSLTSSQRSYLTDWKEGT